MERCRMVFSGSGGQGVTTDRIQHRHAGAVVGITQLVRPDAIMKILETHRVIDINRQALATIG